uniref:DNA-directed DNA polymerase n=1 Tax=candidate division WOR-3 bacterium TaxID=2052148 RepID=A0A7C3J6H7_UNCW3
MKDELFLVDLTNIIYRNFFAYIRNPLRNSKGENTSAIYGTTNFLEDLINSKKIEYIACTIDLKEPTFRHEIYADYKAGRQKVPDELLSQIPVIYEIVEALGINILSLKGYESDDLIASLCKKFYNDFKKIYIVTSDKDMGQLIDEKINMIYPKKENGEYPVFDTKGIEKKLNVKKEQIIDYYSMIGDSVDNVPGIEGIGPKTAEKILDEINSLDDFFKNPEILKNEKMKEKLLKSVDDLKKYRELIKLKNDINIDINIDELRIKEKNQNKLEEIFKKYEIFSQLKNIESKEIDKSEDFKLNELLFIDEVLKDKSIVIFEDGDKILFGSSKGIYETVKNAGMGELKKIFGKILIFENVKNFSEILEREDANEIIDINTLRQTEMKNPSVKKIVEEYYSESFDDFQKKDLLVKFIKIKDKFIQDAKNDINFEIYKNIELPIIPAIVGMENNGIKVDLKFFKNKNVQIDEQLKKIEKNIFELAGTKFNVNSSKQVSELLFEKLNLKPGKKGKTGFSTDYETLVNLKGIHPIIDLLIKHRELSKLLKGYVLPIISLCEKDDIIHTTFEQSYAATGRFSSRNPNLQNVPPEIRDGFIVRDRKNIFVSLDYSQIELRVLAFLSKDKNLNRAFQEGKDIHNETAKYIFNIDYEDIDEKKRSIAKIINFSVLYGKTSYGLSQELSIPKKDAENFINKYFEEYSGVKKWIEETVKEASKEGYVKTYFGRCRYIPEILSQNKTVRMGGERMAINTPIQGTAADIMKIAIKNVFQKIKGKKDIMMILTVHDELIFEMEEDMFEKYSKILEKCMIDIEPFDKILKVNIKKGKSWGEI